MNAVRIQGDGGQFEQKGDEPRRNRMVTLTDTAWARLQEVASKRGVSRSDLIETSAMEGVWSEDADEVRDEVLSELQDEMDELLEDESIVRRRDRAAVRRAILALLAQ